MWGALCYTYLNPNYSFDEIAHHTCTQPYFQLLSTISSWINLLISFQVKYMEQLVQSRLVDNLRPLHDLYSVLHSLCQSLQVS